MLPLSIQFVNVHSIHDQHGALYSCLALLQLVTKLGDVLLDLLFKRGFR